MIIGSHNSSQFATYSLFQKFESWIFDFFFYATIKANERKPSKIGKIYNKYNLLFGIAGSNTRWPRIFNQIFSFLYNKYYSLSIFQFMIETSEIKYWKLKIKFNRLLGIVNKNSQCLCVTQPKLCHWNVYAFFSSLCSMHQVIPIHYLRHRSHFSVCFFFSLLFQK